MKNLISTCLILMMGVFVSHSLSAQSIGIRGGITLANQNYEADGTSASPDSRLGFQGGIVAETNLSGDLYLDAGLLFLQGGTKTEISFFGVSTENEFNFNQLTVPVTVLYKADIGGAAIYGEAGPYVSYALSGTNTVTQNDQEMESDIDFEEDGWNRLDFGLNVGAGVEISQFRVGVHYMLGLANLNDSDSSDDFTINNRILGIYAAYMFGME